MNFDLLIDETLLKIEDAIEAGGWDIDFETAGGVLTLSFSDQSVIIINRQFATQQLWVAAKSGGYHFDYIPDKGWVCDQAPSLLMPMLSRLCTEQASESIELDQASTD